MTPEIERLAIQYATALVEYHEARLSFTNLTDYTYRHIFYSDKITAKERLDAAETALDIACREHANKLATSS